MLAINIDGDVRVIAGLNRITKRLTDMRGPLSDIGNVLVREFTDNFAEEGKRLEKGEWAELALSTQEERERLGYGAAHPILERTGRLKKGFKQLATAKQVRVWNPVPYFEYHQLGTPNMPQRRMISFPERLKQEVVAVFNKYLQDAIRGM